jgi:hypothetical protein
MIIAIVTLLDDIYDSYATPEECELLTKCIQRFVLLPFLKNIFILGLLNFYVYLYVKFP